MKEKCPCEACICVAVCRHKPYSRLFDDCRLVTEYLPYHKFFIKRDESNLGYIEEALEPTDWYLQKTKVTGMHYFLVINEKVKEFKATNDLE